MRAHSFAVSCAMVLSAVAGASTPAQAADLQADPSNVQQQLALLKAGDTLHLAPGTYAGLALSNLNGTATQWITIAGPAADPPTAIVQAPSDGCCDVVEITSSSYLAIENLQIDGNHVPGAFGVSAKGEQSNLVHDVRVEGCTIVHCDNDGDPADLGQQDDGISTKTPTWGWIIRRNKILGAGTGMYLGNSTGDDPFIGGVIEDNLIDAPTGYCIEIKFQNPRPSVPGMPTSATSTIIRNNVFIKKDHAATTSGGRPQLLVGGFPASGPGSQDRYEIYGNLFFHDADDSLLQASGRVTIHDNVFVDAPGQRAIMLRDQDLPLEQAFVYNNTIFGMPEGIVFGNAAPQGDGVAGNLVFSASPITGPISHLHDNTTDVEANAAKYVNAPSTTLGAMDFYPLAGQCQGAPIDESAFAMDVDYDKDFNGTGKGSFTFRGAYAGSGTNPGWPLGDGTKDGGAGAGSSGGGATGDAGGGTGSDAGGVGEDASGPAGGSGDDGAGGSGDTSAGAGSGGCSMAAGAGRHAPPTAALIAAALLACPRRRGRRARERA